MVAMLRLKRPEQIDAERIAGALDAAVIDDDLRGAVGQMIVGSGERRPLDRTALIRVSSDIRSPARRAFTIAHELGHYLLRHDLVTKREACTANAIDGRASTAEEQEANAFASALLLPEAMVAPWATDPDANLDAVREMARVFKVAIETAAIRLVELTPHACAIVICARGRVVRVSRSAAFGGYVTHDWPPGAESGVVECVAYGAAPRAEREVSASTWYRDASATAGKVIEHSLILPGTLDVLTLLRERPRK